MGPAYRGLLRQAIQGIVKPSWQVGRWLDWSLASQEDFGEVALLDMSLDMVRAGAYGSDLPLYGQ